MLGDVGQPQLVRALGGEVPLDEIVVHRRPGFAVPAAALLADGAPPAAGRADPPNRAVPDFFVGSRICEPISSICAGIPSILLDPFSVVAKHFRRLPFPASRPDVAAHPSSDLAVWPRRAGIQLDGATTAARTPDCRKAGTLERTRRGRNHRAVVPPCAATHPSQPQFLVGWVSFRKRNRTWTRHNIRGGGRYRNSQVINKINSFPPSYPPPYLSTPARRLPGGYSSALGHLEATRTPSDPKTQHIRILVLCFTVFLKFSK